MIMLDFVSWFSLKDEKHISTFKSKEASLEFWMITVGIAIAANA